MPQKAKYTEEDYESIYQDLVGASDSNEANEIFVVHADKLSTNYTSLKNGFVAKARWKRRKGDSTWLLQYEQLFPGKVDTLTSKLGTFNKNQIIEWIQEFIKHPLPNMDYVKSSLEGGQNDKFFQGILATFIIKDIEKYDELWYEHRKRIHRGLDSHSHQTAWAFGLIPIATIMLITFNFILNQEGTATVEILTLNFMMVIVLGLPFATYMKTLELFKELSMAEAELIERTNTQIMKKYPKELLDQVWNTAQITEFQENNVDETELKMAEEVFQGDVDFTENGLSQYALDEMFETKIGGWLFSKKTYTWKTPHERNWVYRHFYKKSNSSFVDVKAYSKIKHSFDIDLSS